MSPRVVPGTGFEIVTHVRDVLYDRVPLSAPEIALLSVPAFQRLERIQQLGFVSRIWPGAHHTRFEHSIGVMHLTRLALDHLRSDAEGARITDDDARTLAAAALLHDIGHYPFSHAIEELGPPIVPHESVGKRLIESADVAQVLARKWRVDPVRVAAIVDPRGANLPDADRVLRAVLSGPLDVDKLDYLPRDARACNVPYGGVDTSRLLDSLGFAEVDGETRIVVGDKGVSPLHSLINARQEMFDNVYWHHTNRACMSMLLRAVQEALLGGAVTAEELTGHDDATLTAFLMADRMPDATRRLMTSLRHRHFYKRAVEISARAPELYTRLGALYARPAERRDIERELAARLAELIGAPVDPEAILIDIPKPEKWRTDVWVRFDRPPVGMRPLLRWREVVGFADDDFKRYEEHRRLIRIVAAEPLRDAVRAHWEALLYPTVGGVI